MLNKTEAIKALLERERIEAAGAHLHSTLQGKAFVSAKCLGILTAVEVIQAMKEKPSEV